MLLGIYTGEGKIDSEEERSARAAYEEEFAKDIAHQVCEEFSFGPFGSSSTQSEFIRRAREYWTSAMPARQGPHNADKEAKNSRLKPDPDEREMSLQHQLLNQDYRALLERTLTPLLSKITDPNESCIPSAVKADTPSSPFHVSNCRTFVDAVWRTEWLMEQYKAQSSPPEDLEMESIRNTVRELTFLGMDDYLFRTASPSRLFSVIADDNGRNTSLKVVQGMTNSLDARKIEAVYDPAPVLQLDREFQSVDANRQSFGVTVKLCGEDVTVPWMARRWLPDKIIDSEGLQHLVGQWPERSMYFLDLMRVRSGGGRLGDQLRVPLGENALREKPAKYKSLKSGALLGRYDAYVIYSQVRRDGALNWNLCSGSVDTTNHQANSNGAMYVSRTKRLVRVSGSNDAVRGDIFAPPFHPFAIILISLKYEASRSVVARWLTTSRSMLQFSDPFVKAGVFLSDGWEDIVVLIGREIKEQQDTMVNASIVEQCLQNIRAINLNPFVSGTETLFTTSLLSHAPSTMKFRFACRAGRDGYASAKRQFQAVVNEKAPGLKIVDVAGNKDFELPVDDNSLVKGLHGELHKELDGSCRLETRVMWEAIVEDENPS